jgi:copper resistance protein C
MKAPDFCNGDRPHETVPCCFIVAFAKCAGRARTCLPFAREPIGGSALSAAPQEVTLTFTDTLEAAFSNLRVTDANGVEVSQGKAQVNGNVMRVSVKPLSAGIYKVNWRAVSTDTHKTEGSFAFSLDAH